MSIETHTNTHTNNHKTFTRNKTKDLRHERIERTKNL